MADTMTPEKAEALRALFPPEAIGKLPKPTKRDAQKGTCKECGGWHGLPAVHLDYVGHAAVTDRLLKVDPEWSWEPFATDDRGLPFVTNDGLWINLTVCGVTRPGFGDGNSIKEMIGDAIRNAAMRFGVALDLWAKEDLHATTPEAPPEPMTAAQAGEISELLDGLDTDSERQVKAWWRTQRLPKVADLTEPDARKVLAMLDAYRTEPAEAAS